LYNNVTNPETAVMVPKTAVTVPKTAVTVPTTAVKDCNEPWGTRKGFG